MHSLLAQVQDTEVVTWVFISLIGYGVKTMKDLNENIALVILRVDGHEKTLEDHETRLRSVE